MHETLASRQRRADERPASERAVTERAPTHAHLRHTESMSHLTIARLASTLRPELASRLPPPEMCTMIYILCMLETLAAAVANAAPVAKACVPAGMVLRALPAYHKV